jgi:hypothetical protein
MRVMMDVYNMLWTFVELISNTFKVVKKSDSENTYQASGYEVLVLLWIAVLAKVTEIRRKIK